jgi:hypothetical protein
VGSGGFADTRFCSGGMKAARRFGGHGLCGCSPPLQVVFLAIGIMLARHHGSQARRELRDVSDLQAAVVGGTAAASPFTSPKAGARKGSFLLASILVSGLFALLLSARLAHRRVTRRMGVGGGADCSAGGVVMLGRPGQETNRWRRPPWSR